MTVEAHAGWWTAELVAERLQQAARVERSRHERRVRPAGYRSSWPAHQIQHAMDLIDPCEPMPSPLEITLAEEAMGWLFWIRSPEVRRMLWSRANGASGREMMAEFRRTHKTIARMCQSGLDCLARRLNAGGRRG